MGRKLLVTVLVLITALNLIACGQTTKEESAKTPDTTVTEEVVNQEVTETEENVEPVETMEEEGAEEQVVEEEGIFTEEDALAKVHLLIEAYNELVKSEKTVEWTILNRCEKLSGVGTIDVKTSDGYELNPSDNFSEGGSLSSVVGINYFYNYINKGTGYYDFENYIESNTKDDIFNAFLPNDFIENYKTGEWTTNYSLFCEAIGLANYLKSFEKIEIGEFAEGENCIADNVSLIDINYEAKLILDGNYNGLKAVFDKDGNMLNIIALESDGWNYDNYIFTFPE